MQESKFKISDWVEGKLGSFASFPGIIKTKQFVVRYDTEKEFTQYWEYLVVSINFNHGSFWFKEENLKFLVEKEIG